MSCARAVEAGLDSGRTPQSPWRAVASRGHMFGRVYYLARQTTARAVNHFDPGHVKCQPGPGNDPRGKRSRQGYILFGQNRQEPNGEFFSISLHPRHYSNTFRLFEDEGYFQEALGYQCVDGGICSGS